MFHDFQPIHRLMLGSCHRSRGFMTETLSADRYLFQSLCVATGTVAVAPHEQGALAGANANSVGIFVVAHTDIVYTKSVLQIPNVFQCCSTFHHIFSDWLLVWNMFYFSIGKNHPN